MAPTPAKREDGTLDANGARKRSRKGDDEMSSFSAALIAAGFMGAVIAGFGWLWRDKGMHTH